VIRQFGLKRMPRNGKCPEKVRRRNTARPLVFRLSPDFKPPSGDPHLDSLKAQHRQITSFG
jgi:hypothetical protein